MLGRLDPGVKSFARFDAEDEVLRLEGLLFRDVAPGILVDPRKRAADKSHKQDEKPKKLTERQIKSTDNTQKAVPRSLCTVSFYPSLRRLKEKARSRPLNPSFFGTQETSKEKTIFFSFLFGSAPILVQKRVKSVFLDLSTVRGV